MQLLAGQWDLDLETRRLSLCPRSRAMFGLSGDPCSALSERDWALSIHPDDLPEARQKMEDAVLCGEPYSKRYRAIHPDGTVHPILSVGKPVSDGRAVPIRFVGFNIDLSSMTEIDASSQPSNENGSLAPILTARNADDAKGLLKLSLARREEDSDLARESLLVRARATLAVRRARERYFNRAMLAGPAFDLLVSLYVIDGGEVPTVRRLADLAGVPTTTTLRWLQYLTDKGYLSRKRGGTDRRTTVAQLTDNGRAALDRFFAEFAKHTLDALK